MKSQEGLISLTNTTTPDQKTSQLVQKIERTIALYQKFMEHIDKVTGELKKSGSKNVAFSPAITLKMAVGDAPKVSDKGQLI